MREGVTATTETITELGSINAGVMIAILERRGHRIQGSDRRIAVVTEERFLTGAGRTAPHSTVIAKIHTIENLSTVSQEETLAVVSQDDMSQRRTGVDDPAIPRRFHVRHP